MAYKMFSWRATFQQKAIGSFKLLRFSSTCTVFLRKKKLYSYRRVYSVHTKSSCTLYIFASFHYETISFPERNTLHAYTHTQHIQLVIVHSMCAIRFFATLSLFASRSTYYIYFLLLQLVCCSIAHCVLSATVNYVYNMCIL